MKRWKRWLAAASLLAAIVLVWLLWPDRRVAQAKALQQELLGEQGKTLSAEQRREKWGELRKAQEGLSPGQRQELFADVRKRQQAEMTRYFKLSPAEKIKHLDAEIRKSAERSKQFQQQQAKGKSTTTNTATFAAGKAPGREQSAAARDEARKRMLDGSTPAERAQRAQYMKEMNARRAQLGLPPSGTRRPPSR